MYETSTTARGRVGVDAALMLILVGRWTNARDWTAFGEAMTVVCVAGLAVWGARILHASANS